MAKVRIVSAKELGTNCWIPLRFFGDCYQCDFYKTCNYPEKVIKKEKEK